MFHRLRHVWLPRLLWLVSQSIALCLAGAVLLAPTLLQDNSPRLMVLFARDTVVRRTALVGAVGLAVTAAVFFRVKDPDAEARRRSPRTMAGA